MLWLLSKNCIDKKLFVSLQGATIQAATSSCCSKHRSFVQIPSALGKRSTLEINECVGTVRDSGNTGLESRCDLLEDATEQVRQREEEGIGFVVLS